MASDIARSGHDWLRSPRTNLLAWWIPQAAIVAALFATVPTRAMIWIGALTWMGTACKERPPRWRPFYCAIANVWFWHFSDMPRERRDFRYERNSGHVPAQLESPSLTLAV